jgi:anti-sigma factor RsiW
MSEVHLSARDLEAFVIGALDPVRASEVEAHVLECERCSSALAGEAKLEMALDEIANAPTVRDVPAPRPISIRARQVARARTGFLMAAAGTLSLAAAWMIWLAPASHSRATGTAMGGGDSSDVVATAAAHGPQAAQDAALPKISDAMARYDSLDGGQATVE